MEATKVVLLFNEDDERQREVGRFLKTQKRCKTAFVTELVYEWLQRRNQGIDVSSTTVTCDSEVYEKIKQDLLSDQAFVAKLTQLLEVSVPEEKVQQKDVEEKESIDDGLDMDEDMLLAGFSMFEADMM